MVKPNLFIVGVPRAGTTSIAEYLKQHPEVFMPEVNGPDFFGDVPNGSFPQYFRNEKLYLSLFKKAKNEKYLGDASHLFCSVKAPKRIKKFNASSKIIIILRSPLEIIGSFYNSNYLSNNLPLEEALKENTYNVKILNENLKYHRNLTNWISTFGRENVHIIIYEDLKKNVKKEFSKICKFLKIEDLSSSIDFIVHNKARETKNRWLTWLIVHTPLRIRLFIKGFFSPEKLAEIKQFINKITTKEEINKEISADVSIELKKKYKKEVQKVSKFIKRDLTYWVR